MIQFSDNLNHHQRCNLNRATGDWRPAARAIGGRRPGRLVAGGPGDGWPGGRGRVTEVEGEFPGRRVLHNGIKCGINIGLSALMDDEQFPTVVLIRFRVTFNVMLNQLNGLCAIGFVWLVIPRNAEREREMADRWRWWRTETGRIPTPRASSNYRRPRQCIYANQRQYANDRDIETSNDLQLINKLVN